MTSAPSFDCYELARQMLGVVKHAGRIQLEIYHGGAIEVLTKADDSPVSQADIASEKVILAALADIAPNVPVLAEEQASMGNIPKLGSQFFCVDPLDGTKEFINKNDEFTVNIALIEDGQPVFGVVYAPALEKLYITVAPDKVLAGHLKCNDPDVALEDLGLVQVRTRATPTNNNLSVVASRSHMSQETKDYLKDFSIKEMKSIGSSLKFCLVADGRADIYPRFSPTMAWDTAAGHAIVLAAGGSVVTEEGVPLSYHKPYLNPSFIVKSSSVG